MYNVVKIAQFNKVLVAFLILILMKPLLATGFKDVKIAPLSMIL